MKKMKKLVEVVEVENEGFVSALGKRVLIFGFRYNYAGILEGVNDKNILLKDAVMVFQTGKFTDGKWADAEVPKSDRIYVQTSAIESWVTY